MKTRVVLGVTALSTLALGIAIGWFLNTGMDAGRPGDPSAHPEAEKAGPCPDGAAALYWKAPMDPKFIRQAPGKSPMGMDLIPECPAPGGELPAGVVSIDSETIQNIGVRTARVETRDLERMIRAVGRVTYDERRVAHVHSKVQGWAERLFVDFVGQRVEEGAPLMEIYSPELVATQEELLVAARYRDATAASPFEDVRAGGETLFRAAMRRLELWDVRESDIESLLRSGEIQKTLTLTAPARGVVTELGVRSGMEVRSNDNLYTIADLSHVWVVAAVYEYELPWLALGQTGTVELSYLPGESFSGPITYIAPFLDPETRTAEIRLDLENPTGQLRPEMFGNTLIGGGAVLGATAIPSEAVIRSGRRNVAVVALGAGRFEARKIVLGLESGDGWIEVREGLAPGEEIVVSSHFLIDSESRLQEAVQDFLTGRE